MPVLVPVLVLLLFLLLVLPRSVLVPAAVLLLGVAVQLKQFLGVELGELGDEKPEITEKKKTFIK